MPAPWPWLRYLLTRRGPVASNTLEASCFISAERLHRAMSLAQAPAEAVDMGKAAATTFNKALRGVARSQLGEESKDAKGDDSASGQPDGVRNTSGDPPALQLLIQPLLFPFASWGKFSTFVTGLKQGTLPSALTIHIVLCRPRSMGSVRLSSSSPYMAPLISLTYSARRRRREGRVAQG